MSDVRYPPGGPLRMLDYDSESAPITEAQWQSLQTPDFGFSLGTPLRCVTYVSTPNSAVDDWRKRFCASKGVPPHKISVE